MNRWLAPGVLAALALIAVPSVIGVDMARTAAQAGRTAMVNGAYADAVAAFEDATLAHPESGGYWLGLGMAAAYASDESLSVSAYRSAVDAAPGDSRGYGALAALDPEADEIGLLREASARSLGDPEWAVRLGFALAADGQANGVVHAWGRAVALRPELLGALPYSEAGVTRDEVAAAAVADVHANPRPGPPENHATLWDLALAMDEVPGDAGLAWRAVDAARHGDLETARSLADAAIAESAYDPRPYRALAGVAAFACDAELERRALDLEQATGDAYARLKLEPYVRREFVYREASLGPTQPPGIELAIEVERWPWSMVDRPDCS